MLRLIVGVVLAAHGAASAGLWVDHATFRGPSGGTDVEISLKLSTDGLVASPTPEGERVAISFAVNVLDSSGVLLLSDRWERILAPPPDSAGHDVYFLDSSTLEIPPGTYVLSVVATDRAGDRTYEVSRKVAIPAYAAPGLMASDLLLSNTPPRKEEGKQFVRRGFRVIPSPDRSFGAASPILYVYQEIYNLAPRSLAADSFNLAYSIVDRAGREVRRFDAGSTRGEGTEALRVSGLSLAGIPPGQYDIEARVADPVTGLHTTVRREFQVAAAPSTGAELMTSDQVAKARDVLTYLLSSRERALFESLDEPGKENFVRRFYAQRDPDPGIVGNPYLEEMIRRYDYANEFYTGHTPGWKTDRGRVYITYGPPKEIERHISNPGTKDHEVWTYAIEGQGMFVFVDERGYGDFRLVHSTVRGEIEDAQWEQLLRPIDSQR